MKVDLFYLSPNPYGGWVTFTSHLMTALRASGVDCELFKIRPRSERKKRDFGYGKRYRNISLQEALGRKGKKLIVAGAKQFKEETETLYRAGACLVIHDPTELKNLPENLDYTRCVSIRQIGARTLQGSVFIRHPYKCFSEEDLSPQTIVNYAEDGSANKSRWAAISDGIFLPQKRTRPCKAISTSRIDFDKHTSLLLDANRLLNDEDKIDIRGFENRIYTRFKIVPHYPEWVQSVAQYPREESFAFEMMTNCTYNVDMTQIKGDGGGTQYTWLEAWNAGCIPIIHGNWLLDQPDDMVPDENCIVVGSAEELAKVLSREENHEKLAEMRQHCSEALALHSPELIGQQYQIFLERF